MDHSKLFYVLNGLLNGERHVRALRSGGGSAEEQPLRDGHYYLLDGEADGVGPYHSLQEAWDAGLKAERTQTWLFPLDGGEPWREESGFFSAEETNVATIEEVFNGNQSEFFECTIEGSYDTLTLRVNSGSFEKAAELYRQLLIAANKLR